jgi:hypothetical protein
MARRILNRKDLRADYEAAQRNKEEEEDVEGEDEEEEDDEEEKEEAEDTDETGEEEEAEDEEGVPKRKKRKPAKPAKEPKTRKSRARTPKVTRVKIVWGVFNNSNQRVAVYDYPQRKEADEHAARLTSDKKSTHFVQPVKEPMEEKKEE